MPLKPHPLGLRPIESEIYEKYEENGDLKWGFRPYTGYFHQFSTEGDTAEGFFPVAIVELSDGRILTPCAKKCKFLDV